MQISNLQAQTKLSAARGLSGDRRSKCFGKILLRDTGNGWHELACSGVQSLGNDDDPDDMGKGAAVVIFVQGIMSAAGMVTISLMLRVRVVPEIRNVSRHCVTDRMNFTQ